MPSGGSGNPETLSRSFGMSINVPSRSQKKWQWFDVLVSKDVEQGLFSALQKDVDAFLIDAGLPAVGGIALCERLRAIDRYVFTPTMMLTPSSDESHLEALFAGKIESGVHGYVPTGNPPKLMLSGAKTVHELSTCGADAPGCGKDPEIPNPFEGLSISQ